MIFLNASNYTNVSSIIDINNLNTQVMEIHFRNRMLNNPYLLDYIANTIEDLIISDDDILLIVHNVHDIILNMEELDPEERRNIILRFFNVLRTYVSRDRSVIVFRENDRDLNTFYKDLDEIDNTEIFTDSLKLNQYISNNI